MVRPMDAQIEHLLCETCGPIVAAALEVERTQLAAKLARDKLRSLGINTTGGMDAEEGPVDTRASTAPKSKGKHNAAKMAAVDPFKGRRSSRWRDIPLAQVLLNIRGDVSPNELCDKLGIATSVLRSRVRDVIGTPDSGKRWQKGIGYIVKGKSAWDHERRTLRVDKTKGLATAALNGSSTKASEAPRKLATKAAGRRTTKPGPSDEELQAYAAGKLTVTNLARKYKCTPSKIYRAINYYKVRFGADAPHGEPKQASPSNGAVKPLPNGVKSAPVLDMSRIVNGN